MAENPITPMDEIITKYTKSQDYRIVYADGAVVGFAAAKAITIDFFVGNFDPVEETAKLVNGEYVTQLKTKKEREYTRERQIQVVITPENAEAVCQKILERVETLKQNNK